jgi:hypothetical protein
VVNTPGIARGIDVAGSTVAVSDGSGVTFYDASDPTNPRLMGTQPTGGVAWDGAFGGRSLFVANDQGLTVIENVAAPPRIDASKVALTFDGAGSVSIVGGAGAVTGVSPLSLQLRDAATAASVTIPIVSSDGSFTTALAAGAGDAINATATDGASRTAGPVSIGTVPFGTTPHALPILIATDANFRARTVAAEGSTVVVAGYPDATGSVGGSDKIAVYDIANPAAPVLRRTLTLSAMQGSIRDVAIQSGWAFIVGDRFATVNLADQNAAPIYTDDPCGRENAVALSGGYAFTAEVDCSNNGTIFVYDVSNPAAPRLVSTQSVAGVSGHAFTDLLALGTDYLVGISNSTTGRDVMIFDRRDVNSLRKVGELSIAGCDAFRGRIVGNLLYIAGGDAGVAIVDLSNPASPQLRWSGNTAGIARGIDVAGNIAAVADGDAIAFYDAADPASVHFLGSQSLAGVVWDVAFTGSSVVAATDLGLTIVDRVYAPPQIALSLIAIASDGASTAMVTGSSFAVGPSTSTVTLKNAKSGAIATTTPTAVGSFAASIPAKAGEAISITATDAASRSATRTIGSVPFTTTVRNEAAVGADIPFRARRVAIDGTSWLLTNGTLSGAHMSGGSSRALLFRQPDASAPPQVTAFDTQLGTVEDVAMRNGFAYVVGDRFATVNTAVTPPALQFTNDPCGRELAIAVAGNYAFSAETDCANSGGINIYDVTNPAAPAYVRSQSLAISGVVYRSLIPYGTQYLIAITPDKNRDVTVIDRSNVNSLSKIVEFDVPNFDATFGAIDGTTLYLAGGDAGVALVDISNPATPVLLAVVDTPGIARSIAISRPNEIAVADGGGPGLTFIDTSDRMRPIVLGSQPLQGNAIDVKSIGNQIYVATETRGYVVRRP